MGSKFILLFLCLFIGLIKKYKSSTFKIKFKKYVSPLKNFILSNYNNEIYISLKIGNPHQNIDKIFLKSDTHEFMIANKTIDKSNYNNSESSTSKIVSISQYYQLKYTFKGYIIKEHFYLDNNENNNDNLIEIQNITFIYASIINIDNYTAILGLKLDENGVKKAKSLPEQLNELKYIKDSTWMIQYTSNHEGNIFIGEILNTNVFPGFNKEEYRKTNAIIFGHYLSWDLLFTQIELKNIKLNGPMQANLDFNFGLISCSNEYYNSIKNEFFNNYLKKGICNEYLYDYEDINNRIDNIKSKFNYITCKKSLNYKKFPKIKFYHTELDFVFELTYEDVFITSNDKVYFLCINEIKNNQRWILGKAFFKKYNVIFDHGAKTIGIYMNYSKNKVKWIILEWFIVIILFLSFLFLLYTFIRRYRLNNYKSFEKRIKVDELNEQFYGEYKKEINFKEIKEENKIIDGN